MFFKVFIVAANILIIDVISCSNKVNLLAGTISVSIMISTQYLNSCASFKAISYLLIKSLVDCADLASAYAKRYPLGQLAPIDVPERKNCLDKTLAASS